MDRTKYLVEVEHGGKYHPKTFSEVVPSASSVYESKLMSEISGKKVMKIDPKTGDLLIEERTNRGVQLRDSIRIVNIRRLRIADEGGDPSDKSTTGIRHRAFIYGKTLQEVSIESRHISYIDDEAFMGCEALRTVSLPESLQEVGKKAFAECTSLESISIPDGVRKIGEQAFSGCTSLHEVILPANLETVGKAAFLGCTSLRRVVVPDGTQILDDEAFREDHLDFVFLPPDITIGNQAFDKTDSIHTRPDESGSLIRDVGGYPAKTIPMDEQDVQRITSNRDVDYTSASDASLAEREMADSSEPGPAAELREADDLVGYLRLLADLEANVFQIRESYALALSSRRRVEEASRRRGQLHEATSQIERARNAKAVEAEREAWQAEIDAIARGDRLGAEEMLRIGDRPSESLLGSEPTAPTEPTYEKPGLLNRKKVEARNEEARRHYLDQVEAYAEGLRAWRVAKASWDRALAEWEARRGVEIEAQLEKHGEFRSVLDDPEKDVDPVSSELVDAALVADEMCAELRAKLSDAVEIRSKAYSTHAIFPKYRTLEAMSTICEYFETGRCSELAGPSGAYNLYESEARSNAIISRLDAVDSKLDAISEKLDDIRQSQYILYTAIEGVNQRLDVMSETMASVLSEVRATRAATQDVSRQVSSLVSSSRAIAYWTKRNAQLTNSLGYLIAFTS